jgi:hypothetical protein
MASGEETFEISQLQEVTQSLRELGKKAEERGIKREFRDSLKTIMLELQTNPLEWGDPEYHPHKKGSTVCHKICGPLFIQYVVFEIEKKVMILKVIPFPKSSLN